MRASQKALSASLGTAVVIDNQPGAGGIVGTQTLVKAAPDGATLSVVSNNHVIYPSVYKTLPFDPIRDITPIAVIGGSPMVLVVNPKLPARDSKELVALLKAKPDTLNYAQWQRHHSSSGGGDVPRRSWGEGETHPVQGRGADDYRSDRRTGGLWRARTAGDQAHLKSGALRAIGTSSKTRLAAAPNPDLCRAGLSGYLVEGWFAVIGPEGLPTAEVKRINAAFASAFATADVKKMRWPNRATRSM